MVFKKWLSNLKFLTQILCFTFIINVAICCGFIYVLELSYFLTQEYIIPEHIYIFNGETSRQVNYYQNMYQRQVRKQIKDQYFIIYSVSQFYEFVQKTPHSIISGEPQQCSFSRYMDSYNYLTEVCYYTKVDPSDDKYFFDTLDLIPLLTQFLYVFDFENLYSIFYMSHIPGVLIFEYPSFVEDNTPIYTDDSYLELQSNFFGPLLPIDHYPTVIVAIKKLINMDDSLQGFLSIYFKFAQFQNFENIYYYIADSDGFLAVNSDQFTFQTKPYIYNQSMTGFNYKDWMQISESKDVVLYNSLLETDVHVLNLNFTEFKISLILFKNTKPDITQLNSMMNQFLQLHRDTTLFNSLTFCLLEGLISLIQVWLVKQFLKPISAIIQVLERTWLKQNQSQFKVYFRLAQNQGQINDMSIFRQLMKSLQKFLKTSKSKQASELEQIEYPKTRITSKQQLKLQQLFYKIKKFVPHNY